MSARHAVAELLRPLDALRGYLESMLAIRPSADAPRVSRSETGSGVVRAGLEPGREAAPAVLRPLVA